LPSTRRIHAENMAKAETFKTTFDRDVLLDSVSHRPIVLIGTSLGAAVALQEAAVDPRVRAVVAAETFPDLRSVATERAPWFFTNNTIRQSFEIAERQAHFRVEEVSPVRAAANIHVPVLLIHGAADVDTRPAHSERVLAALRCDKPLIVVPGAAHDQSLRGNVWATIDDWIVAHTPRQRTPRGVGSWEFRSTISSRWQPTLCRRCRSRAAAPLR
jgi:pimeloyl-ACP methyl ester carboxylesterase